MEVSRCDSRYLCFILERMHPSAPHNLKVHSVVLPFDFLFALPLIACVIRLSLGLEKNLAFLPSQCKSISCTCDLCYKAFQMDPCHFSNSFKLQTSLRYLNFTGTLFPTSIYTLEVSLFPSHPSPTLEEAVVVWSWCQTPTRDTLSLSSTMGQGRENITKGSLIKAGRDPSPITVMGITDLTCRNQLKL